MSETIDNKKCDKPHPKICKESLQKGTCISINKKVTCKYGYHIHGTKARSEDINNDDHNTNQNSNKNSSSSTSQIPSTDFLDREVKDIKLQMSTLKEEIHNMLKEHLKEINQTPQTPQPPMMDMASVIRLMTCQNK